MNFERALNIILNQNKLLKISNHNDLFILFNNCLVPNIANLNKEFANKN